VRQVEKETQHSLAHLGQHEETNRDGHMINREDSKSEFEVEDVAKGWKWSDVQGAVGWWQILMHGVWLDGVKVLYNQPIILDVST
jgi:hypothetical protein